MTLIIALLLGLQISNPIVDTPVKDNVKNEIVSKLIDNVQGKIDTILDAKEKADAAKAKIAAAKKAIADKIAALKQQLKEDLIAQKKEQVKAKIEEIKARVDAIKEAIAQLQAIAGKFNAIKSWVEATPELPKGWVMVILRPSDGGLKPVVVRPESATLPSLPPVSAYVSDLSSIAIRALDQCKNGECGDSKCSDGCDDCKCSSGCCSDGGCSDGSCSVKVSSPKRRTFFRRR